MAITLDRARKHVEHHTALLKNSPRNARWPGCLFFCADLTVAREILRSGELIPRQQQDEIIHDVAHPDVIAHSHGVQHFTRLYFRPKNGFHLRTEGIKALDDPYRFEKHMSIPIMLVFDAVDVLTIEGVGFTDGNAASWHTEPGFDQAYFDNIPFEYVYHDRAVTPDTKGKIHNHRQAEVLYPDRLPLRPYLRTIVCRSNWDKLSLLNRLPPEASDLEDRIVVEQIPQSVFMRRELFINQLTLDGDALNIGLALPVRRSARGQLEIKVSQFLDNELVTQRQAVVGSDHRQIRGRKFDVLEDDYWSIELEDVLAFEGCIPKAGSTLV